jgi:hypothetical protein
MANRRWLALTLTVATVPALLAENYCPGSIASVPLRRVNRYQMIVPVSVNHTGPYDFLLDTGTQVTIIDSSLAGDLHLDSSGQAILAGVGIHESASMASLDALAVGDHLVSGQRIVVSDLARMTAVNLHIQGILGEDFLEQFDMLIDNLHGVLCLDDVGMMRSRLRGPHIPLLLEQTTQGTSVVKSLIMNVHFLKGMRPVRMKLDSGANAPFLYKPSDCLDIGVLQGSSWHGSGLNGEQQAFVALPPQDMTFNGLALSRVPFLALRNERKDSHSATLDGLLPTGLFRRVFVSQGGEFAIVETGN